MSLISENANKAAQWWADQLKSPSVKLDNGTNDIGLHALLSFCGPKSSYTDEQLNTFRSHLIKYIESELAVNEDCMICVGYSPDETLEKAAELAGIKFGVQDLPWTTWTKTSRYEVRLSHGYAADQVVL